MGEIDDVLNGDEHVLWEGRPAPLPFFASTIGSVLLGSLLLAVTLPTAAVAIASPGSGAAALLLLAPFLLVGLALAVGFPLFRLLLFLGVKYAITDKRVLLQSGIIEREILMVDFDQISEATVKRDLLDLLLGLGLTGSVRLARRSDNAEPGNGIPAPYVLSHVAHPYAVFAFFHRAEYDVKTDIVYPNELRPETNPGYDTTYSPPPAR